MPKIVGRRKPRLQQEPRTLYTIRIFKHGEATDKTYLNPEKMKRWRNYYLKRGFKVRKI